MKPTFEKTIDVLVRAYMNDTLRHGSCYACAVGNIILDATGAYYIDFGIWSKGDPMWQCVFVTNEDGQQIWEDNYSGEAKKQIDSTGYTWQELARVEYAFENVYGNKDEKMYNGLMAVVDVLAEIHQVDLTVGEQAKQMFKTPMI